MTYQYNPYIFPLALASLITLGLSVYLWRRRSAASALPLLILLLAVAEWSATYALELSSSPGGYDAGSRSLQAGE